MADHNATHTMNIDSDDDLTTLTNPTTGLDQPGIPQQRTPGAHKQWLMNFDSPEDPPASFERRPPRLIKLIGLAVLLVVYSFGMSAVIGSAPGPVSFLLLLGWLAVLYFTVAGFMNLVSRPLLEFDREGISCGLIRRQSSISWFEITRVGVTSMMGNSGQIERLTVWTNAESDVTQTRPFNRMVDSFHGGVVLCELKDFRLTKAGLAPILERYAGSRWDPAA